MQTINTLILRIFLLITFHFNGLWALTDLEERAQDFVLETKQIIIPEFPDAFNPSIIDWDGKLLMTFRARDPISSKAHLIGLIWLDNDLNPISEPTLLISQAEYPQDPRLFALAGRLYIAYSDLIHTADGSIRRMCLAQLTYNGRQFRSLKPEVLLDFESDGDRKFEKNWSPFIYNDCLLLSYTLFPHKIFFPFFNENRCSTIDITHAAHEHWKWGEIRGGTSALRINNQYLGFFHSSIETKTVHSEGKKMPHYFMGAYIFSGEPPFQMTSISPEPIIGANFYNGKAHTTWKPLRVVFPGGFVFNENFIWVAYGRQDHELWIVKLDRKGLLDSLMPIQSNE
jgi:predicted GH43/DUF377 family glycosyl hydrolase